jgi:hypothetical protein
VPPSAFVHRPGEPIAGRLRHRDVRHQPLAEEALVAGEGAVDELVDHHEMAGRQVLAQRAAGRQRQDVGDADPLQGVDVGAVIDR